MDPAVAGLVGAFLGALTGMAASVINNQMQNRQKEREWNHNKEQKEQEWLREKREEAFANAQKSLLRAVNVSSLLETADPSMDHRKEFLDQITEGQYWVRVLRQYSIASVSQGSSTESLDDAVRAYLRGGMGIRTVQNWILQELDSLG